ncbi:MAG: chemotaxis protein CheW [Spirochaetales bacterium]|nr:chemotaxis protein CheW [Spirochaetales bacterium]
MEAENQVLVATDVASMTEENNENATVIDFKMVTFSLAGRDYSIDIMHVKEIAKAGRFTYVPNALPFVLGVYNLRGEIIPILDLRLFFNIPVEPRKENSLVNLLILTVEDQIFGVVVDKIDKVVGVQKSTIQPPHPLFGDINIKYIDGVVEANKRLYVLLDITRIFSSKESLEVHQNRQLPYAQHSATQQNTSTVTANDEPRIKTPAELAGKVVPQSSAPSNTAAPSESEVDLKFIKESLQNYAKFYVSSVNEQWITRRYNEWKKETGSTTVQLQTENDAKKFIQPFWSTCSDAWWTEAYAKNVEKALPDNSAKQIIVWNPGCGKGMETYSLACVLKKRYPNAKIRIYAQDIDLLNVSNASLLSVPEKLASDWYGPYLTKKANGDYTFSQEIKDSIMFEYHDCKNTNALPMVDVVFARDILSLMDENAQEAVVSDFLEKMKGNAIAIIGENEALPSGFSFGEKTVDTLVVYTKD